MKFPRSRQLTNLVGIVTQRGLEMVILQSWSLDMVSHWVLELFRGAIKNTNSGTIINDKIESGMQVSLAKKNPYGCRNSNEDDNDIKV